MGNTYPDCAVLELAVPVAPYQGDELEEIQGVVKNAPDANQDVIQGEAFFLRPDLTAGKRDTHRRG
jgi:hypothetical protein